MTQPGSPDAGHDAGWQRVPTGIRRLIRALGFRSHSGPN